MVALVRRWTRLWLGECHLQEHGPDSKGLTGIAVNCVCAHVCACVVFFVFVCVWLGGGRLDPFERVLKGSKGCNGGYSFSDCLPF